MFASLTAAWGKGRLAFDEKLDQLLIYTLRTSSADRLRMIVGADEGLEMLMKKHAETAGSRGALLKAAKCKRYTHARLNRYCANLLLGMTKGAAAAHPVPEYIRVLGFRRDAARVLREIKNRASLPLVTDPVKLKALEMFSFDRAATDLRAVSENAEGGRAAGLDLTHPIVVI